jgi:hypothetical protein
VDAIPGKHSIHSLQKTAMLGTSHIIWEYFSLKLETREVRIIVGSRDVPGTKGS